MLGWWGVVACSTSRFLVLVVVLYYSQTASSWPQKVPLLLRSDQPFYPPKINDCPPKKGTNFEKCHLQANMFVFGGRITYWPSSTLPPTIIEVYSDVFRKTWKDVSSLQKEPFSRWWFQIFFMFTRTFGEWFIQFDFCMFVKWVGEKPPTRLTFCWFLVTLFLVTVFGHLSWPKG